MMWRLLILLDDTRVERPGTVLHIDGEGIGGGALVVHHQIDLDRAGLLEIDLGELQQEIDIIDAAAFGLFDLDHLFNGLEEVLAVIVHAADFKGVLAGLRGEKFQSRHIGETGIEKGELTGGDIFEDADHIDLACRIHIGEIADK